MPSVSSADAQKSQEQIDQFKAAMAEAEKKLEAANKDLEALKAARDAEISETAAVKARDAR